MNAGDVIENLALMGQSDDNKNGVIDAGDKVKTIHFSDYYQKKQIQVLVVIENAGWAGPSRQQQADLVRLNNMYKASGHVAFLEALWQDKSSMAATIATIDAWAAQYSIGFDMAIDPQSRLLAYQSMAAIPANMVIRTRERSSAMVAGDNWRKVVPTVVPSIILRKPQRGEPS